MTYTFTPYVLLSGLAAVVSVAVAIFVAVIVWPRRKAPGGQPLMALLAAICVWTIADALGYAAIGIPNKLVWSKVYYIGAVTAPVLFLLLALEYHDQRQQLSPRTIVLLFVVPAITCVLAFTNEQHGLIWSAITPVGSPEANLMLYSHGPAFYVCVVGYSYSMMTIGTVFLVRSVFNSLATYRSQGILMLLAAFAPWIGDIIYVLGYTPIPGLELTPLMMVFSGIIFSWAILSHGLFDLLPLAYDKLIQTMDDGLLVLDARERIIEMNPAAQRLIGMPSLPPLGSSADEIFANWPEWLRAAETIHTGPVELKAPGPEPRTLELNISPIQDMQGVYQGRLVAMRDITELKMAQQAIVHLNSELEERVVERTRDLAASQERFSQVVASISDHVFAIRVRPDGNVEWIFNSPRLLDMTGYSSADQGGDLFTFFELLVHSDDRPAFLHFFEYLQTAGFGEIESRLVQRTGNIVWVRTSVRIQKQGYDTILYGVVSDITERKRIEQAEAEIRTLSELDKLRAELVSNVSHELRTPLGLIKVAATTLQRRDVVFPQSLRRQLLQNMSEETDRLEHLVSDLLDISRIDQQRFPLNWEQTDLNALLTEQATAAGARLESESGMMHSFVLHLPDRPVVAIIDAARIEQVLRKLFENALRYSPEGGNITVTLTTDAHSFRIDIADQGIGIAEDEQARIFERFYRGGSDRVQRTRGAGLGLALCREIVQAHEGTMTVTSTQGKGATFSLCIPLYPHDEEMAEDESVLALETTKSTGNVTGRF